MLETGPLVTHEDIKLRQKERWGPAPAPEIEIPFATSDESAEPDYVPASMQPSWAAKLKKKLKKLFCTEA